MPVRRVEYRAQACSERSARPIVPRATGGSATTASAIRRPRRILVIARSLPAPADDGYRIRVRQLVRGLAARHEVVLVAHGDADNARAAAIDELRADGIEAHAVSGLHHATTARRLGRLARGRSWFTRSSDHPELRSVVGRLGRERRFDIVELESSEFADLPLPPRTPVVIDEHNIWSELTDRRRVVRDVPVRGLFDRLEAAQLSAIESRAWSASAGVAFCSDREVSIARRRVPAGTFVSIPNGVDVSAFESMAGRSEDPNRLVFVGLLRYTPNADAVRWFSAEILPRIRARAPEVRLDVVGKGPTPEIAALAGPGVEIVGSVPDVRPAMSRASVVVVPLRVGSGTRIKILEALAMGKAVVTTSVGCEGLAVCDDEHVLVADTPEGFADAVIRLLADVALRRRLGAAGRVLVARDHLWSTSVDRLDEFHDRILERSAALAEAR